MDLLMKKRFEKLASGLAGRFTDLEAAFTRLNRANLDLEAQLLQCLTDVERVTGETKETKGLHAQLEAMHKIFEGEEEKPDVNTMIKAAIQAYSDIAESIAKMVEALPRKD